MYTYIYILIYIYIYIYVYIYVWARSENPAPNLSSRHHTKWRPSKSTTQSQGMEEFCISGRWNTIFDGMLWNMPQKLDSESICLLSLFCCILQQLSVSDNFSIVCRSSQRHYNLLEFVELCPHTITVVEWGSHWKTMLKLRLGSTPHLLQCAYILSMS